MDQYCSVTISSNNLSGQTVYVTYYPTTGGTIYLGAQVFPFTYESEYYEGLYRCYSRIYRTNYDIIVGQAPLPSQTPTPTLTQTPTNTATPTVTPTNTPSSTDGTLPPSQTPTPSVTQTPTPTTIVYDAYIFAEPQDSVSSNALGEYMYNNGAMNFFGYANGGVPSNVNYENDLIVYSKFGGFVSGSTGNFITRPLSFKGNIRQSIGTGVDSYGCVQNQYTFGTIEIKPTDINPSVQYFYSMWIPLFAVGNQMNNMTVDISLGTPCYGDVVESSIPSPLLSAIDVDIPQGCAIPEGRYRVLWMPVNGLQPAETPLNGSLFFKGNSKN